MAIKLSANYSKKLGLPQYSSHSFSASVEVELSDITQVENEVQKLYQLLQHSVDQEIQHPGYVPTANSNGNGHAAPQTNGRAYPINGHNRAASPPVTDRWNCTDGQRGFILRIVNENVSITKQVAEDLSQQLFGIGVKQLNKMQASQLIEDLLVKAGKPAPRQTRTTPDPLAATTHRPSRMNTPAASPPERSEQDVITALQATVSASRLSLFLQCRLKFYFRYVLKLKKPKTASLHLGNAVHAVLKAWNKARWVQQPLSLKVVYETYQTAWADNTEGSVTWETGEEEADKTTGWRLLDTYLRESHLPAEVKPDAVEVPVEADLQQQGLPRLIGILDLVQQRQIIDYKTSATTPNADKVAHSTEIQTSSYAILYRQNTGAQEAGMQLHHLVKLKNPKVVITTLPPMSPSQETRLFRQMEAYLEGLQRRDFIPSPGMHCSSCEFFNECKLWH